MWRRRWREASAAAGGSPGGCARGLGIPTKDLVRTAEDMEECLETAPEDMEECLETAPEDMEECPETAPEDMEEYLETVTSYVLGRSELVGFFERCVVPAVPEVATWA